MASDKAMDALELLPCPFCGGNARFLDAFHTSAGTDMILCGSCGCRYFTSNPKDWNRRQAQEAPRGYDLENQKAENLGSWRLPLEAQEAPKAEDLQEVIDDYRRLTRELDVALNGDGSAKQASLCDIVAQVKREKEAPKAESQSAEDDFGPVNLNDEEPDKLKAASRSYAEVVGAAREARAWIDGILCQCDTTVDHVCDRCVLIRSIDKALSALDEAKGESR